jgi:bacteriorhodopsin
LRLSEPSFISGGIPVTITNVYIGSIAADLATIGSRTASRSSVEWTIYGIGFIITIVAVIYITLIARKALDSSRSKEKLP